jgi:CRISPR-associated protein Cmx8
LKWSDVKENPEKKKKYEETKEKVAKDAFFAVRSRTEQSDFVNYFVSTLCSVPQFIKPEEYVSLTKALYDETDRVRTLTLLALSANS